MAGIQLASTVDRLSLRGQNITGSLRARPSDRIITLGA
jgi:hypothetical protein